MELIYKKGINPKLNSLFIVKAYVLWFVICVLLLIILSVIVYFGFIYMVNYLRNEHQILIEIHDSQQVFSLLLGMVLLTYSIIIGFIIPSLDPLLFRLATKRNKDNFANEKHFVEFKVYPSIIKYPFFRSLDDSLDIGDLVFHKSQLELDGELFNIKINYDEIITVYVKNEFLRSQKRTLFFEIKDTHGFSKVSINSVAHLLNRSNAKLNQQFFEKIQKLIPHDERLQMGQTEIYLKAKVVWKQWYSKTKDWDHDHCEFCGAKFSKEVGDMNEGYYCKAKDTWICEKCFDDFSKVLCLNT